MGPEMHRTVGTVPPHNITPSCFRVGIAQSLCRHADRRWTDWHLSMKLEARRTSDLTDSLRLT